MAAALLTPAFLLLLTQFLAASAVAALFFPLQGYLAALGIPAGLAGFILGADALAALGVQGLITPWVGAHNARRWLAGGALTLALALGLEGTLTAPLAFAAARLLQGAGFICLVAGLMPLFVLCIPRARSGQAFAWISLARLVPYALVPPLFDLFGLAPADLGQVLRWAPLLALLALVLLRWLPALPGERDPPAGGADTGVWTLLTDPYLGRLFLATGLLYAGYAVVFFYLKGFAEQAGIAGSGTFFSIATGVMIGVRLGAPGFDRLDKRHASGAALLLAGAAMAALPWAGSELGLWLLALPCGIGWGIAMPLVNALLFDVSRPETRALAQNLALLMLQAGFFLGPWLAGWLLPQGGPGAVLLAAGALLLAAAGPVLGVRGPTPSRL